MAADPQPSQAKTSPPIDGIHQYRQATREAWACAAIGGPIKLAVALVGQFETFDAAI
jgi:hypothetical protein